MRAMLSVKQARGRARAGPAYRRRLLWHVAVEHVLPNLGQDLGVAAAGCGQSRPVTPNRVGAMVLRVRLLCYYAGGSPMLKTWVRTVASTFGSRPRLAHFSNSTCASMAALSPAIWRPAVSL